MTWHWVAMAPIIYDGFCPVCSRLAAASRLRERAGELVLVDARTEPVDDVQGRDPGHRLRRFRDDARLDFEQGFAVLVDGQVHFGAEGARVLALMTEPTGLFYRLFQWLVRTQAKSRIFYPVLRADRPGRLQRFCV